ncbi:MAG TPA: TonB-dependent receptor, partial [Blastocatellia bacterium]
MNKLLRLFSLGVILAVAALIAQAQSGTSRITGTVTDPQGAVVANAPVTATNEATGVNYTQKTTSAGVFAFADVPVGDYTITVEAQGFRKFISTKNVLTVGSPLVVDVTLQVGSTTEVVEVQGGYERIETSNATISDVLETKQIQELPLNGRNPLALLTLEPGVVQRTTNGTGSGTHVFGSRDRAHNVTIDGIDANESTVPNPQSNIQRLNPDNVQEFRTVTLGATAETGRNSGANVMVATRGGSNSLHGAVYYFNRNTAYNANEWFNNASKQAPPELKLHQYGFDIGGPIRKDKTFFFGSFQGNLIKQTSPISAAFGTPRVYTATARTGIFRFVRGKVTASNGLSFTQNDPRMVDASGNLLPGIALCGNGNFSNCVDSYNIFANDPKGIGADPAVSAFIKSLPLPNGFQAAGDGLNNAGFLWNPPTKFVGPHIMARIDHRFNERNNIFGRWLQNHYDTKDGDFLNARPQVFPGYPPLGEVSRLGKNLAVSYRRTITPNLVNELTGGFNHFAFAFTFGESNPNFGDPSKLPPWADECIYGSFSTSGNINTPYCVSPHTQRGIWTPQFVDNLSWLHGAHTFHAGINFRFYRHDDSRGFFGGTILAPGVLFNQGTRQGGFLNIPGTIGGNAATTPNSTDINRLQQAIVEFLGIPAQLSQSFFADFNADQYKAAKAATVKTRAHQYDSYVQDEWKPGPNLTLNLGVRWEYNPAPYDAVQTLVPNVNPDGSQGTVSFVKADRWFKNNNIGAVGPRIGIAWSPDNKMVVRAGYSLLFDVLSTFQVTAIAGKVPGFMQLCSNTIDTTGAISTSVGCVTPSGLANRISTGFPLSVAVPTITPSRALTVAAQPSGTAPSVGAFDPNMQNPSVHEWSLTIQRELPKHFVAQIGYIGKRGTHLYRAYDLNQGSIGQPGFLDSFNIARANFLAGCRGDGTGCPAGVTGQTPTLLLQLVSPAFVNSSASATNLQRGDIGSFAGRMDALALTSSQRRSLPLNYFRPNPQF